MMTSANLVAAFEAEPVSQLAIDCSCGSSVQAGLHTVALMLLLVQVVVLAESAESCSQVWSLLVVLLLFAVPLAAPSLAATFSAVLRFPLQLAAILAALAAVPMAAHLPLAEPLTEPFAEPLAGLHMLLLLEPRYS